MQAQSSRTAAVLMVAHDRLAVEFLLLLLERVLHFLPLQAPVPGERVRRSDRLPLDAQQHSPRPAGAGLPRPAHMLGVGAFTAHIDRAHPQLTNPPGSTQLSSLHSDLLVQGQNAGDPGSLRCAQPPDSRHQRGGAAQPLATRQEPGCKTLFSACTAPKIGRRSFLGWLLQDSPREALARSRVPHHKVALKSEAHPAWARGGWSRLHSQL